MNPPRHSLHKLSKANTETHTAFHKSDVMSRQGIKEALCIPNDPADLYALLHTLRPGIFTAATKELIIALLYLGFYENRVNLYFLIPKHSKRNLIFTKCMH